MFKKLALPPPEKTIFDEKFKTSLIITTSDEISNNQSIKQIV